ncbi:50S ribosomal protein L15e [Candidatus Woesearchaeota archaeon]|nr:50S ribosomal protein L15e [Candidatus Woesearchaeota archaeon]
MGLYKYLRLAWKNPSKNLKATMQARLIQLRNEPTTLRIPRPTRLDRARGLGYRAKQGIIVVRQKVKRGGHVRTRPVGGRKSGNLSVRLPLKKNYQWIAEERVSKKYHNCEVLNSYLLCKDGSYAWYEIILVDKHHPAVLADKALSGVANRTGRAERGITSAGRKSRGLRYKGKGAEKARPSRNVGEFRPGK